MEVVVPLLNALSPLQVLKSAIGLAKEAHVECILEAVQSINIVAAESETGTEEMRDEPVDSRLFLNSMLPPAPNSALPAPEKQRRRADDQSASAETSRGSTMQAAKKQQSRSLREL
jgi:hypothetical protein